MLEAVKNYVKTNGLNVYDVAYANNSGIIYEALRSANPSNNSYSVSKSVTATVAGIAIDRGLLSLNTKILQYFSDILPSNYDKKWEKVTVWNLLTHSMGQERGYLFDERYEYGNDWTQYIFSQPLKYEPGEKFIYTNSGYYLLTQVIEKATGCPFEKFIADNLFLPLGFREYALFKCPKGNVFGASGFYLRTVDLAKLGLLYANGGIYAGKRLLSEKWVNEASTTQLYETDGRGYTLGFWRVGNDKRYFADGAHGQLIFIDSDKKAAIAVHSYLKEGALDIAKAIIKSGV